MARRIAVVAAVLLVLWLLFAVVFPWVDRQLNDPVLGDERIIAATGNRIAGSPLPATPDPGGGPARGRPAECGGPDPT